MKSSKPLKKILKISTLVLLVGVVIIFVGFASANFSFDNLYDVSYEQKKFSVPVTDIKSLQIELKVSALQIHFDNSAEQMIVEYSKVLDKNGNTVTDITMQSSDGNCKLDQTYLNFIGVIPYIQQTDVVVTIPSSYQSVIKVNLLNGAIKLNGKVDCTEIALSVLNGSINTTNAQITADKVSCTMVNGSITLGNISAIDVITEVTNGTINIQDNIVATKFSAETTNGKITTSNCYVDSRNVLLETVNGNIEFALFGNSQLYSKSVSTVNGNANVVTESKGERYLNVSTVNGDIVISFVN